MSPISTGKVLNVHPGYDECEDLDGPCELFTEKSDTNTSNVFRVLEDEPLQIKAFNIAAGATVKLVMLGGAKTLDYSEDVMINGSPITLTDANNYIVISSPGLYRLEYDGTIGSIYVQCSYLACCMLTKAWS